LNLKQRRFAEYFSETGNATEAAKRAGYSEKTAYSQGQRLLKNAEIAQRVRDLNAQAADIRVASATEAKALLSDMMKDPDQKSSDRIRAAELLLRSSGAFVKIREDDGGRLIETGGADGGTVILLPPLDREEDHIWNGDEDTPEGWTVIR